MGHTPREDFESYFADFFGLSKTRKRSGTSCQIEIQQLNQNISVTLFTTFW
jgi:hypothetical protein